MFCGYCGKEISEDYSFCTGCGKPLDRGTTDQTFQSEDKEKKYESSPQDTQDVEYNETNPLDQSIELKPELDIPTIFHQEEQNFETHEESLPTSKYISVKFWKHCDWPWQARSLDGENILGTYGTELEAAEAVAKFHGITVDVLLEEGINLTEDEVEEKKRLLIEKALIKSKSTPSPMSIDKLWNAPPKKSPSTEDSASYDSPFSESLPAGLTNTPMPILGKEDAPLGKLMTDQLSENQNQKLEKKPPPIWEPITLFICAYVWGVLHYFKWEWSYAIFMITEVPGLLIGEALGTAFPIVFGLIHLAISQFFKSKRNSYSRRYIIIYWSIAALLLLLLASYGQAKHRGEDVTQDYKEDEKWDRKAAEQGNSEAQSRRGLIYEKETEKGLTQRTIVPLKNSAQRTPLPGPIGGDLEQFQTLVRQIPNDPRAHDFLGDAYKSLGRYKEAFASYKEALRVDPNYFTVHRNLGWAYEELGRYQEAIASYKEALRIKPDYTSAHNGLGSTYNKLGQYKEAIASYKEALRIDNYFTTHDGLGNAYAELGQYKEAIASYKEALSINPKNTTVRNLLNNLEQKTAYGIENELPSQEQDAKKMTDYYKGASDQEIDKFIIGLTNAKKKVLPTKLNKGITLYKVEYLKDHNVVIYGYEVNADNSGLTEKELVAAKQTVTYNLREHHKRYFCTVPVIRMELDIGIDFLINIISANDNFVGSYQISKGDCIN